MSSWCEMGWNLGFFLNEVVDKVSVTLFPQRNSHPSKLIIIASLKHPPPQPLRPFSLSFILSLLLFSYYSRKYGIVWNSCFFFSNYIHTVGILYFFSPNSCIKITLFYNTTVYKLTQSSFILITQILYKHLLPKI